MVYDIKVWGMISGVDPEFFNGGGECARKHSDRAEGGYDCSIVLANCILRVAHTHKTL